MAVLNNIEVISKSPAVSIIVPVYNAEPWLTRCLDSLRGQTIENIEIICIDDKSTDNSLKILREHEKKDSRIKVIAQEKNSGVSIARNTGLAIAVGEYVGFVDPDDFVDSDFYEKLYGRAVLAGVDIAKGKARIVDYDGRKRHYGPGFADINKNRAFFSITFWSAIYRRGFLIKNKIEFPPGLIISEDTVFLTKAVILANKIELVEGIYYHYIRQKDSLYSEVLSVEKLKCSIKAMNMIIDFINDTIIDDRETYSLIFAGKLKWLLSSEYSKSYTFDGCAAVIHGAIELYKKCKYKDDLCNMLAENHARFLSEENEVALFADLLRRVNRVILLKLFNFIPLLKIIYRYDTVEIMLFRWIPLMKINKKRNVDYYYLFFYFQIIRNEIKKN